MFVRSGQDGCECCWILSKHIKGLDGQIAESVASSSMVCQFLCIAAMKDFPMPEKNVMMGRIFLSVCGVR